MMTMENISTPSWSSDTVEPPPRSIWVGGRQQAAGRAVGSSIMASSGTALHKRGEAQVWSQLSCGFGWQMASNGPRRGWSPLQRTSMGLAPGITVARMISACITAVASQPTIA